MVQAAKSHSRTARCRALAASATAGRAPKRAYIYIWFVLTLIAIDIPDNGVIVPFCHGKIKVDRPRDTTAFPYNDALHGNYNVHVLRQQPLPAVERRYASTFPACHSFPRSSQMEQITIHISLLCLISR